MPGTSREYRARPNIQKARAPRGRRGRKGHNRSVKQKKEAAA